MLSTLLEMMHWREDLPGVATLSRVPPDLQHHGVLLGDEPTPLVKGHDWRLVLSLWKKVRKSGFINLSLKIINNLHSKLLKLKMFHWLFYLSLQTFLLKTFSPQAMFQKVLAKF